GVVDGDVSLQDLRAGRRRYALRPDHVLERDRDAFAAGVVAHVQVAMELGIALADRLEIRGEELRPGDLPRVEELLRALRREAQRVDHELPPGGTRKKSPSRSGAFASASSTERQGRGSSAPHTLTTSSGCDVGGTSSRSSSATFETAARMSFSCTSRRASSSSRSSSRARWATWRSSSRDISGMSIDPKKR